MLGIEVSLLTNIRNGLYPHWVHRFGGAPPHRWIFYYFSFFLAFKGNRKRINFLVRFLKGKPTTGARESMVEWGVGIHLRGYAWCEKEEKKKNLCIGTATWLQALTTSVSFGCGFHIHHWCLNWNKLESFELQLLAGKEAQAAVTNASTLTGKLNISSPLLTSFTTLSLERDTYNNRSH